MEKICKQCNSEFEAKVYNQLFCNIKCKEKYTFPHRFKIRYCLGCNTELDKFKRKEAKYCCRKCMHKHTHKVYNQNSEFSKNTWRKIKLNPKLHEQCKQKNKLISKKYRDANKDKRRIVCVNYARERRKTDVIFRLQCNLRRRLNKALIDQGAYKLDKSVNLFGCTPRILREHIENQFTEGMSWENYGKWHLDHILPCVSFDLYKESEQKKCFHYTNLQPLWAEDNLKKGAKY